jgi:hypothetical protein
MTHTCSNPECGETDITKFRTDKRRGTLRSDCRKCENKARSNRAKRKKRSECESRIATDTKVHTEISKDANTGIITAAINTVGVPADPIEYLQFKGIDTEKYSITNSKLKSWPTSMKLRDKDGAEVVTQIENFGITATIVPKVMDAIAFGLTEVKYDLPKPKYSGLSTNKGFEKVLVIPDIHFGFRSVDGELKPTHDPEALAVVLHLVDIINPDLMVFLGDTMDWPQYGRHPIGYDLQNNTEKTLDVAREFFYSLRKITDCQVEVLEGNHDCRPLAYIRDELKKLATVPGLEIIMPSLSRMLGFDQLNITYHGEPTKEGWDAYNRGESYFQHRDMLYIHGVACGKDAPTKNITKYMMSVCTGHIHKAICQPKPTPVFINGKRKNKVFWAISPGYLGTRDTTIPSQSSETDYQQGITLITHVDVSDNKDWSDVDTIANPIHFVNGKCFYGGEVYSAA